MPQECYRCAYEPGCDHLLASDFAADAVDIARKRIGGLASVHVEHHVLPADWPREAGRFDLIVQSELDYFLDHNDMHLLAACCQNTREADGTLVACDGGPILRSVGSPRRKYTAPWIRSI